MDIHKSDINSTHPCDDLPPKPLQRTRNTLPKARQKEGPPPEHAFVGNAPSRTVSGENINTKVFYNRERSRNKYNGSRTSMEYSSNRSLSRQEYSKNNHYNSLPRNANNKKYDKDRNLDSRQYRGRGRTLDGRYHGNVSRAPSERKINSLQRKKCSEDQLPPEVKRACSLPRTTTELNENSLSSPTVWRPDGKCPSFADMLKLNISSPIVESNLDNKSNISYPKNETYEAEDSSTDKENLSQLNVMNINSSLTTSDNEISLSTSNKDSKKHTDDLVEIDYLPKKEIKGEISEDSISISSQKNLTLKSLKSYANILSGGLKKVGNALTTKAKEIKNPAKSEEKLVYSKSLHEQQNDELHIPMPASEASKENFEKPTIPGLLFKTDLERRPSKKKRKSKSTTNLLETHDIVNITDDEVKKSEIELQSNIFEIMTDVPEKSKISYSKSLDRKNSKKKRQDAKEVPKFADDIDKALHEIKLIEEKDRCRKERSASFKERSSDRARKCKSQILETSSYLDINENEEIQCLKEERSNRTNVKIYSSLQTLVHCKTENKISNMAVSQVRKEISSEKIDSSDGNKTQLKFPMDNKNQGNNIAVEIKEIAEIKSIDENTEPEKEVLESKASISLPMKGATEAWMDDDDNFGGFSSSDDDQVNEDEIANTMPEERVKEEDAVGKEESKEIKAIDEKNELKKEVLKSKAAISLPMIGATEAWMDDNDNFGGFSSSDDDPINEDEIPNTMPEMPIDEKIESEKEVIEHKAAISLPMTGATEVWMDDDDKFGGFSSSDDDQVNKDEMPKAMPEENIEEAAVEIKESRVSKTIEKKN